MIGVDTDTEFQQLLVNRRFDKFSAWEGRDTWHRDVTAQVRLEHDKSVFIQCSKATGHAHMSLDEFSQCLADIINQRRHVSKSPESCSPEQRTV